MKQNGSTSRVCNVCGNIATHFDVQPDTDYCDEHFIDYNECMVDKALQHELDAPENWPEDDDQVVDNYDGSFNPYDST